MPAKPPHCGPPGATGVLCSGDAGTGSGATGGWLPALGVMTSGSGATGSAAGFDPQALSHAIESMNAIEALMASIRRARRAAAPPPESSVRSDHRPRRRTREQDCRSGRDAQRTEQTPFVRFLAEHEEAPDRREHDLHVADRGGA